MGQIRKWTLDEEDFLTANYVKYGAQWCAEQLNRSKGGVSRRASKLGLKPTKLKHKKEQVIEAVINSKNLSEVLKFLGLRSAGGNFETIKKCIDEYEIDTSHFETNQDRYERSLGKLKTLTSLDEMLVENSTYSRKSVKARLINEGILEYKCNKCGNNGTWLGEKLVLQLEHKNGVYNDNRLENLELLCPNCHTQTKTYAGKSRNTKQLYICSCGNKRDKSAKNCRICQSKVRRIIERPPYQQLVSEIEEIGHSATGRKYGVSDNAIRKWVEYYEKYEIQ